MIQDLMELNDFVVSFCNNVVHRACESTTSGQYYVNIQEILDANGWSYDDFLEYKDLILNELASREELLDVDYNEDSFEFDVNCGLSYCPGYQWCDGDEEVFGCSFEEWLEMPTRPIADRPTYSQLLDTNYAQSVAPSVYFYVGDGIDIDKDYAELGDALDAFKRLADRNTDICLGVVQRGEAHVLLDNLYGSINLAPQNLNSVDPDIAEQLQSFMKKIYPENDLCVGKYRVHVLTPGSKYGAGECLTFKDKDSCVEFWDMSQDPARFPNGQFTGGRYYIETLYDDKWGAGPEQMKRWGLQLDGDVPVWHVSGEEMTKVFDWLKNRPLADGEHYLYCSGEVDVPFEMRKDEQQAQGYLYGTLASLALARDINVEHMGVYNKGNGFTFSFVSYADKSTVEKAIASAFVGFGGYELACESKKFEANREPLDSVIDLCEKMSKENNSKPQKTMTAIREGYGEFALYPNEDLEGITLVHGGGQVKVDGVLYDLQKPLSMKDCIKMDQIPYRPERHKVDDYFPKKDEYR